MLSLSFSFWGVWRVALWDCSHVDLSFQNWEEDETAMELTEDKKNHKEEDEEEDMKDESKANGDSDLDPENESEEE